MGDIHPSIHEGANALGAGLGQFAAVASIFDAAEVVLYVADLDTHELLFLNDHAARLWGFGGIGKRCYQVLQAGQSGPCAFCTNHRLTADGRAGPPVVWEFQNTVNRRWYLCIDKAIPWSDGRLVRMEVAIDITERKAHEQFREQYVGLISHDLRSPLSTIALSASTLKLLRERQGLSELEEPVEAILRNSRRMAEMIEELLETTRLESGQPMLRKSRFDLGQLAGAVLAHLGAQATRPVRFESAGPVRVLADVGRMERVLENLVGNALRYSPPGMPVAMRVEANESEAVVAVADRGIGIAAEELPKLFQPFYRVAGTRAPNGLGLGLYNSRLIVERHGGRIWAESEAGAGSTFSFALPMTPAD
jgi:two-component system, OmpR family, phosphate regulon sensor histidine kinase PhoR